MEVAAPWWAAGAFGLIGVLLGSAVAYLSAQKGVTRQIDREERHARRQVYATFIKAADEYRLQCDHYHMALARLGEARAQISGLVGVEEGGEKKYLARLETEMEDLSTEMREFRSGLVEHGNSLELRSIEVFLYASGTIRDAVGRVNNAAAKHLRACAEGDSADVEGARDNLHESLGEFTVLARADIGAPDLDSLEALNSALEQVRHDRHSPTE